MASYNRQIKLSNSPYEIGQGDPLAYAAILHRIKSLHLSKRRRFEQTEIETEKYIERQFNENSYVCNVIREYLQGIDVPVEIIKGEATPILRESWRLHVVISPDGCNEINRADHRFHAINSVVIALTTRNMFLNLATMSSQNILLDKSIFDAPLPWNGFYEDVCEKIDKLIVSYAPTRKISGSLHMDTAYGYSESGKCFVSRKSLDQGNLNKLTETDVKKIRDAKVRELVESHIARHDGYFKKAMGSPLFQANGKTPIKSVRISCSFNKDTIFPIQKGQENNYKFFAYGNNHHVEIIENIKTGNREGRFVTVMEAARRARGACNTKKVAIVQRDHGVEWKFVSSLSINDIVYIATDRSEIPYRIQAISKGSQFEITLKRLNDALSSYNENTLRIRSEKALKKILQKISIDPLGNIAQCSD
jgi:CRISPR/Cas system Type II protein with McrA/HNH and RuvC-like nuclease domain